MSKLEQISDIITKYFGTTIKTVKSRNRVSNVVKARHLICYFANHDLRLSYTEIGEYLEGRDHTTIINSCTAVKDSIRIENYLFEDYNHLKEDVYKIAYKENLTLVMQPDPGVDVKSIVRQIQKQYPQVTFLIA